MNNQEELDIDKKIITDVENTSDLQENTCYNEMLEAFNFIESSFIKYQYSRVLNDSLKLFFCLAEKSWDTINCNFSLYMYASDNADELKYYLNDFYYFKDSDLIIIGTNSPHLISFLKERTESVTKFFIQSVEKKYTSYSFEANVNKVYITTHDFGITASYESKFKRVNAYSLFMQRPVFIFEQFRKNFQMILE